jgi:hypothetical protein
MAKGKFVSYLRVSTDKRGRSGLGLEAQREAVTRYLNGGNWTVVAEYVEPESGKRSDRPKLAAALSHAKAIGATLVFAKLDRLTRKVDLLRTLVASGVDGSCFLPSAGPILFVDRRPKVSTQTSGEASRAACGSISQLVVVIGEAVHNLLSFCIPHALTEHTHFSSAVAPVFGIINVARRHRSKPYPSVFGSRLLRSTPNTEQRFHCAPERDRSQCCWNATQQPCIRYCAAPTRLDPAREEAHKAAAVANEAAGERHAATVLPIIREIKRAGARTLREIADALNARGTRAGGQWYATTVRNVLARA